jgi:hypothetical protein
LAQHEAACAVVRAAQIRVTQDTEFDERLVHCYA